MGRFDPKGAVSVARNASRGQSSKDRKRVRIGFGQDPGQAGKNQAL